MLDWRPTEGQVALIEPADGHHECLTGVVLETHGDDVIIDLGGSPPLSDPHGEVAVSFFSPEALFRIDATAAPHDGAPAVIDLRIHDIERVQRRTSPRMPLAVPVVLSNFDDIDPETGGAYFASVTGCSIDLGRGGCRVAVAKPFPAGCDPTVTLHVSPIDTLVAIATVLEETELPDGGYEYRLVFTDPDDGHTELVDELMANAA
jgi:hypothetical protein